MFYRTKFNILTTALSNKIGENYTCFLGANGGVSYIENGSLTSKKTITGSGIVINRQWEWHLFKVFEGNALITNPAVSDVFGEGLTTINQFTIYTDKDSYFDFEEGLPSTVTNINRLFYPDAYCNFKNLENCFKKSNPRV